MGCMSVEPTARPAWMRTGYKFFPYAARYCEQWWVLRLNYDFPEHDLYTVFIDGRATADVSGNPHDERPFVAGIGALRPFTAGIGEPDLAPDVAETVVRMLADYVVYGSEVEEPCDWCGHLASSDPMERR
jgi:hypothetical protein